MIQCWKTSFDKSTDSSLIRSYKVSVHNEHVCFTASPGLRSDGNVLFSATHEYFLCYALSLAEIIPCLVIALAKLRKVAEMIRLNVQFVAVATAFPVLRAHCGYISAFTVHGTGPNPATYA